MWHTGVASLIVNEQVNKKLIFYKCIIRVLMETICPEVQCLVQYKLPSVLHCLYMKALT